MRSAAASTSKKAHSAHTILFESITAMPHQQTARGPGTFASNLGYLLADTHTLMGCDPKLSSCDSIGFVRPVSLKKNSPLIKLRVGWFSALFFGLNSLTWAWCEFALNQARLAPMPWLTLGSQACASVRDLGSLQYLMGAVFALSLPSPWPPRQTLQSQKRKSWISATRHLFWSCPEIGVPEKSDS